MTTAGTPLPEAAPQPDALDRIAAGDWVAGPPGWIFLAVAAIAIAFGLDANSRDSFDTAMLTVPVWFILAGTWTVRFLLMAWKTRLRRPVGQWIRWLVIPVALGTVFVLTSFEVPFDVRAALSRGAMNQAAAEVMAGGSTNRGWIGLYPVEQVERIPNGMRFLISGSGFLDRTGFAFSTTGMPDTNDAADEYEPLDGGWFLWVQTFNFD